MPISTNEMRIKKMKLNKQYKDIKNKIFRGLESQGTTKCMLKDYFISILKTKANGDFNRACVWVGFPLNGFWRDQILDLYHEGINDDHIKSLYRKFFTELGLKG